MAKWIYNYTQNISGTSYTLINPSSTIINSPFLNLNALEKGFDQHAQLGDELSTPNSPNRPHKIKGQVYILRPITFSGVTMYDIIPDNNAQGTSTCSVNFPTNNNPYVNHHKKYATKTDAENDFQIPSQLGRVLIENVNGNIHVLRTNP